MSAILPLPHGPQTTTRLLRFQLRVLVQVLLRGFHLRGKLWIYRAGSIVPGHKSHKNGRRRGVKIKREETIRKKGKAKGTLGFCHPYFFPGVH